MPKPTNCRPYLPSSKPTEIEASHIFSPRISRHINVSWFGAHVHILDIWALSRCISVWKVRQVEMSQGLEIIKYWMGRAPRITNIWSRSIYPSDRNYNSSHHLIRYFCFTCPSLSATGIVIRNKNLKKVQHLRQSSTLYSAGRGHSLNHLELFFFFFL